MKERLRKLDWSVWSAVLFAIVVLIGLMVGLVIDHKKFLDSGTFRCTITVVECANRPTRSSLYLISKPHVLSTDGEWTNVDPSICRDLPTAQRIFRNGKRVDIDCQGLSRGVLWHRAILKVYPPNEGGG